MQYYASEVYAMIWHLSVTSQYSGTSSCEQRQTQGL